MIAFNYFIIGPYFYILVSSLLTITAFTLHLVPFELHLAGNKHSKLPTASSMQRDWPCCLASLKRFDFHYRKRICNYLHHQTLLKMFCYII